MQPSAERIERAKPRAGCWFLTLPIFAVGGVFAGYAYLLYYGMQGRSAEGEAVSMSLEACPEARPVLQARLATMGLPEAEVSQEHVRFQLTGDEATDGDIPAALSLPGQFEVRDDQDVLLATTKDIERAGFRLDVFADPHSFVRLTREAATLVRKHQEANPHGSLQFLVDGGVVATQRNLPAIGDAELELRTGLDDPAAAMRLAVNRGIALEHPLPCPVRLGPPRALEETPDAP